MWTNNPSQRKYDNLMLFVKTLNPDLPKEKQWILNVQGYSVTNHCLFQRFVEKNVLKELTNGTISFI